MTKGWHGESQRHSLAARGIRSSQMAYGNRDNGVRDYRCRFDLEELRYGPDEDIARMIMVSGLDDQDVVASSEHEARVLALERVYGYLRDNIRGADPLLLQQSAKRVLPKILDCEEV